MSNSLILGVAIFAFVLMAIGLLLTVREFYSGQPKREAKNAEGAAPKPYNA